MKRDIVKVQLPLETNAPPGFALIYNKDQSLFLECPIDDGLIEVMNGEPKQFFYYKMMGEKIAFLDIAPWQEW